MINYDRDVNKCNIEIQAMITCVVLTSQDYYLKVYPLVVEAERWCDSILYFNKDSKIAKKIKSNWKKDISDFINDNYSTVNVRDPRMKSILETDIPLEQKLNIAMSVARWPEFYIYSDQELRNISVNIRDHKDEINAITFYDSDGKRICPYNPDGYHNDMDWEGTLINQEPYVREFMSDNNINSNVTARWIINEIYQIYNDITGDKTLEEFPAMERGFISSCRKIRQKIDSVASKMMNYIEGNATFEQFGLSESRAPISDSEPVMQTLHGMGYNKKSCPMVLANLFYGDFNTLDIKPQPGQIHVKGWNSERFHTAPGAGPAYKCRYVFNADPNIQNLLSSYAKLIQDSDKLLDPMEAYNKQMDRMQEDLAWIVDAFCTDTTGFSDYMTRCIYQIMMKIHGMPDNLIEVVMKVFRMPIDVGGDLHEVKFGSMQGVKLLVFIMNHANRLMGILANRFSKCNTDCRCNAGDDVEAHSLETIYDESDVMAELAVFSYFNCPTNVEKAAWLERDGYFDFCSKYYARIPDSQQGVFSITGLPPKIAGKEIISITGFSEIFKVLDIAKTYHRSSMESWNLLEHLLRPTLEEGMMLPSADKSRTTLDDKIKRAKNFSYDIGGIADIMELSTEQKFSELRYKMNIIMQRYKFDPSGIFLIINQMDDDFKSTPLFQALGTIARQSMKDIVKVISILNSESDDLDADEIDWAIGRINRFERNIIRGLSVSRSSSTYHRKNALTDIDMYVPEEAIQLNKNGPCIPAAETLLESSMLLGSLANQNYTDIDNVRRYVKLLVLYRKYKDKVVCYEGYGGQYYYALVEDGQRLRLTSDHSNHRHGEGYIWPSDVKNPDLLELHNLIRESGSLEICESLNQVLSTNVEAVLEGLARDQIEDIAEDEIQNLLTELIISSIDF